jgi:ppGpp synthetase/RelA/SpoT-type nucleotidyltranferase
VNHYIKRKSILNGFLEQIKAVLLTHEALSDISHSIKWRLKDPNHLKDKLMRRLDDAKLRQSIYKLTTDNLFQNITDLIGFRILHLHTRQFMKIDEILHEIFREYSFMLKEGPVARCWDDETRDFFRQNGVRVVKSPLMYTSVHYIIKPNKTARITCEIQVRTLLEEVWGEVDHLINYPHTSESTHCREQIKVLARINSGCSRLVDSIFNSYEDLLNIKNG